MTGYATHNTTLRPRQNGRHFADDTFKRIFLNENVTISIKISLKFVPKGPINNIPALVHIMAWRRPGDKPLYGPMMVSLQTHICVLRPQWAIINRNQTSSLNRCAYAQLQIYRLYQIFLFCYWYFFKLLALARCYLTLVIWASAYQHVWLPWNYTLWIGIKYTGLLQGTYLWSPI